MVDMPDKQFRLDQIRRAIIKNNICSDLAAGATNLVMGDGNVNAEIVLIGEAPGKKEDEQGVPFVGAAGKFLNEMLAHAELNRADVYITNIVKYRPPNNRDPRPEEKAAFLPFLLEQLQIIQPKVVITLGRHSMEYFLPNMKISEVHGRLMKVTVEGNEFAIMPLYHPAAALYNGSMRQILVSDFVAMAELVSQIDKKA